MTDRKEKVKNNNSPIKVVNILVKVTCCFEYYNMRLSAPLSNYGDAADNKISANVFGHY